MKYGKQFLYGCGTALSAWAVFIFADSIDEFLLDVASFFGGIVFFFLPVMMFIKYIVHYIRSKPVWKKLLFWFLGYYAVFLPIWLIIYDTVNNETFFIRQKRRAEWLDLNGIEYIFYGFTVLLSFTALCLIFHFVYYIVKKLKKRKSSE